MTGFPAPLLAMAVTVAVPEKEGSHCAKPFVSTVTLLVTVHPLLSLMHQVASGTASGLGGAVYCPVALNCTFPPAAGAVAVAGVTVIEVSSRAGPRPLVQPGPAINMLDITHR